MTLDLNLSFSAGGQAGSRPPMALPGLAIAEVKQDGVNRNSAFVRRMREMNQRPAGFSKYCAGVTLLHQEIKHNNFKPRMRTISKLIRGDYRVH